MSPLRLWLRKQRALAHQEREGLMISLVARLLHWAQSLPNATISPALKWSGAAFREPRADVHIHGRDCDAERHFQSGMIVSHDDVTLAPYSSIMYAMHGCDFVDGEWPS